MDTPWTDKELELAILSYFVMLEYEKNKTLYVKAEMNRKLQEKLPGRERGSIEYRWQNISAVLYEKKLDFIAGYKPAGNVGNNVKERIWQIIISLNLA